MLDPARLSLLFPDLHLPVRSMIGVTEEVTRIGEEEIGRSWNGRAIPLEPSYTLYGISLSSSGKSGWTPAVDNLRFGDQVTVHSGCWRTARIAPGQVFHQMIRPPVYGPDGEPLVYLTDVSDPSVHSTVNVNAGFATFQGAPANRWRTLHYRPVFDCVVAATPKISNTFMGSESGWSLELEEFDAP